MNRRRKMNRPRRTRHSKLIRFEINKHGEPLVVDAEIAEPGHEIGIYSQNELLYDDNGTWKIWSRHGIDYKVEFDINSNFGLGSLRTMNARMHSSPRTAGAYPVKCDPAKNYKCKLCGDKAYWSTWCYNCYYAPNDRRSTNGRILHFCLECTKNKGTHDVSKRAHCKITGEKGTDILLYSYEDRDEDRLNEYGSGFRRRKLTIKCRIKADNVHLIKDLKTYPSRRWWNIDRNLITVKGL
jgi:hypothetical protein